MIQKLVKKLMEKNLEISTMESCTGGSLASEITSVEGASEILKFSAVTYSNEYKIKMGVSKEVIEKYSVYSMEVAKEMSKSITKFAKSDIGVGITGKINRHDPANPYGEDNLIYISIYFKEKDIFYQEIIQASNENRKLNKMMIVNKVADMLLDILIKI